MSTLIRHYHTRTEIASIQLRLKYIKTRWIDYELTVCLVNIVYTLIKIEYSYKYGASLIKTVRQH